MTENENDLTGMSAAEAKEYILSSISTLKLTEKEIDALKEEALKWKNRVELARSKGMQDILAEAEREAERVNAKLNGLLEEALSLKNGIADMRRQLPTLAAKERSVDPDYLEQELLMALGQTEEEAATEKAFRKLEKENAADSALEALKSKMKGETT
ncbi:MAG: chromosome partitioning protein [Treponema sp.]|jgi:phage shock protein A|nr:chromosome partitioning protein [Treponema sp.]